jgi:hypothetical protein
VRKCLTPIVLVTLASTVPSLVRLGGSVPATGQSEAGSGTDQTATAAIHRDLHWGSTIAGVSDTVWVAVRPLTANIDIHATMSWREFV